MQLLMVRHALPERSTETADPGLTALGFRQAAELCHATDADRVTRVVVSPQRRARETAEPLSRRHGIVPTIEPGLAEYDLGHRQYIPFHEAAEKDPDTYERIRAGLLPGYVDEQEFRTRVVEAVGRVVAAADHTDTVAVVSHGGAINALLQHLLGLRKPMTFALEYVSVSRVLVSRNGTMRVASVNEVSHVWGLLRDRPDASNDNRSHNQRREHVR